MWLVLILPLVAGLDLTADTQPRLVLTLRWYLYQLTTYPQTPFSGPAPCCDVTDLYQAFSQRTGPGRFWTSLHAGLLRITNQMHEHMKPNSLNRAKEIKQLPT